MPDKPIAHRVARAQAALGRSIVANLRQENVMITAAEAALLQRLDGTLAFQTLSSEESKSVASFLTTGLLQI
jgi:hypothetical protein